MQKNGLRLWCNGFVYAIDRGQLMGDPRLYSGAVPGGFPLLLFRGFKVLCSFSIRPLKKTVSVSMSKGAALFRRTSPECPSNKMMLSTESNAEAMAENKSKKMLSVEAKRKAVLMIASLSNAKRRKQEAEEKAKKEKPLKIYGTLDNVIKAAVSGNPKSNKKKK